MMCIDRYIYTYKKAALAEADATNLIARTRQSVLLPNVACSYALVVVTISSLPCLSTDLVVTAVI